MHSYPCVELLEEGEWTAGPKPGALAIPHSAAISLISNICTRQTPFGQQHAFDMVKPDACQEQFLRRPSV